MDVQEKLAEFGEDTPLRAKIAHDILAKALNTAELVRVERTVTRNGTSYLTHKWVRPDNVRNTDAVTENGQLLPTDHPALKNSKETELFPLPEARLQGREGEGRKKKRHNDIADPGKQAVLGFRGLRIHGPHSRSFDLARVNPNYRKQRGKAHSVRGGMGALHCRFF